MQPTVVVLHLLAVLYSLLSIKAVNFFPLNMVMSNFATMLESGCSLFSMWLQLFLLFCIFFSHHCCTLLTLWWLQEKKHFINIFINLCDSQTACSFYLKGHLLPSLSMRPQLYFPYIPHTSTHTHVIIQRICVHKIYIFISFDDMSRQHSSNARVA